MNFKVKESENWPTEEDLEPHVYANGRFDVGDYLHVEWQVFMKDNLPKKAIPFVKLNQSEISKNRWGRDTFFCEIWNMSGGRFSMIDIQKLTTAEYYKITHELEEMENVWNGKYNESKHDSRKRIQEAQANMAYYGFKRVPERDFSDDGTRFFMWVWDPEDTGHSPFYFSKAGGYDMVFFSEHFGSNIRQECRRHGYNNLDDLNGISKSAFTDEALGKIVAQLQKIRESDWFESLCPEFSTRGAIDQGIEVKDYNADKDHQRVMDFAKRAGGDTDKMIKLAANMAKAIKDEEKMRSRWQAAVDIYGSDSPVAKAFEAQANANHWHLNIRPRSGDIDWSSLFESISLKEEIEDWDDLGYDDPDAGVDDDSDITNDMASSAYFREPRRRYYTDEEMAADGYVKTGLKRTPTDFQDPRDPENATDIFVDPGSVTATERQSKERDSKDIVNDAMSHQTWIDNDRYLADTGMYSPLADDPELDTGSEPGYNLMDDLWDVSNEVAGREFSACKSNNIVDDPDHYQYQAFNDNGGTKLDNDAYGYPELVDYSPEDLKNSKNIQESISLNENINDEHIYKAHAEYEKDQLKKKEEEDNQENFTFDEGSVKLTTVKESNNVAFYLCYDDDKETYLISKDYVNDDWNVEFKDISSLDEIKNLMPKLNALANEKVPYWRVTSRNHGDFGETMFLTKEAAQASYEKDREYWKSMDYSSTFYKYKKPLKKILSGCSYSTSDDDKINYIKSLPWTPSEEKFSESKKIKESMEHPYDILIARKESEKGKSIEDKWRYADEVQNTLDRVNDSHLYKVCPIFDGAVLYYWNEDGSVDNIDEHELGRAVERFIQGYKDFDIEIADKKLLPILSKSQSDLTNKKLFGFKERKYWNNFFDKLTESVDGDRTEDLLKDYFDTTDVELSDETCWGLPVYIVDNMRYAVGDTDEAYEAAVKQAISVYEDDTDEGKINWLQEHHWPGVDEEGVCEACGDDPDDYEEGETIYQPSSIDEYIDTMGFSQASDAFSMAFLGDYINKQEIGEYVVDNDGVGALASEDGNEISIGDDLSAFCLGRAY